MAQVVKKPVSWFKAKPQARKRFDEKELRQLGESLKVRQLQPLVCLPDGTIIAGERRYRAALLAGMTELEVKIIDDPVTEAECKRLQFIENMQRQDLTGYEQWQGCVELLRLNPGWTQKQLAEQLHLDPSMVIRLLSPSKCIESVQAALAQGRIGISDCYAISRLERSGARGGTGHETERRQPRRTRKPRPPTKEQRNTERPHGPREVRARRRRDGHRRRQRLGA